MRKEETAFIEKITAAMTHEFMNVLSTIKESSGLMADLLSLSEETSFPHHVKFTEKLAIIREQVKRGMELSDMLNRFAHGIDEPKARIELNELLTQLSILVQRFAALKKVELTLDPVEAPLELRTDPFRLQLILVACLETCFDHVAPGGRVTVRARKRKEGIGIQCLMEPDGESMKETDELLRELAGLQDTLHRIDAQIRSIKPSGQPGLELILSSNAE
jgi:signal transduction histidine kinase